MNSSLMLPAGSWPLVGDIDAKLSEWAHSAEGAFAHNTIRAWRADWRVFSNYCLAKDVPPLPATPAIVREFVMACAEGTAPVEAPKRIATIRRYVASISRIHHAAGVPTPTSAEAVSLALRAAARTNGSYQRQASPLNWSLIQAYLRCAPDGIRDHRDRAMVCVAYDALLRAEEVVSIDLSDICFERDGSGFVFIAHSKSDQEGEGAVLWLAPSTIGLLKTWIDYSGIKDGAVFRRVIGARQIEDRLTSQSVTSAFRRLARRCHLAQTEVAQLSSHSARVGATQDLLVENMEMPAIMQQGRWADPRMPARYGARVLGSRGAMAQLAKLQGRTALAENDRATEGFSSDTTREGTSRRVKRSGAVDL